MILCDGHRRCVFLQIAVKDDRLKLEHVWMADVWTGVPEVSGAPLERRKLVVCWATDGHERQVLEHGRARQL